VNLLIGLVIWGILGIIYTNKAKKAPTYEEAMKNIELARIMCIIGTVFDVIVIVCLF
jgi:hypothetical protein